MEHSEDLYWLLINGSVVSRFIIWRMPRSLAINSRSMGHPAWMRKRLFIVSSCCAFHKPVRLKLAGQRVVCLGTSQGFAKHSSACIVCSLKQRRAPPFLIIWSLQPLGRKRGLWALPRRGSSAQISSGAVKSQQEWPGDLELRLGVSLWTRYLLSLSRSLKTN